VQARLILYQSDIPQANKRVINAIEQANKYGILGKNILKERLLADILFKIGAAVCLRRSRPL
jgi:NADH:ubiquinone oxidoreductase subunit F (NADH-binding)